MLKLIILLLHLNATNLYPSNVTAAYNSLPAWLQSLGESLQKSYDEQQQAAAKQAKQAKAAAKKTAVEKTKKNAVDDKNIANKKSEKTADIKTAKLADTDNKVVTEASKKTADIKTEKTEKTEKPKQKISAQLKKQYRQEVEKLCDEIGNLLGSVSVEFCKEQQFVHSGHYSVKHRALVYKDFTPPAKTALPKVLVIGGIHGDEYSAFSIIFRWLELLKTEQNDHKLQWRLLPAANPDGLLEFKPAQRMNANGVDLNRNFLTLDWRSDAIRYWQEKTGKDKRRYPGTDANSEPETKFMSEIIETWQPDVIVSVHAPYGILDFDATTPMDIDMPNKIGMLHLKLLGTYPGSLGRYAASNRNIPVLTMELPHAGIMPSKDQQQALWNDLIRWLTDNLND